MSSTGRGPRLGGPEDFYVTPSWAVRRLLEAWHPPGGTWLEPGAGNGAIIRAVNGVRTDVRWIAVEIREEERVNLEATGASVYIDSFIDRSDPSHEIAAVIGNPPFSLAQEFIDHARAEAPRAQVAMLLRLNFVGSEERAAFMQRCTPDIKTLPNRPSFLLRLTDSIEYAWFIWPPGERSVSSFQVLASTRIEERQRDMPQVGKCPSCAGVGHWLDVRPVKKKTPGATPCTTCLGFGKVKTGPSEVEREWQRSLVAPPPARSTQLELAR